MKYGHPSHKNPTKKHVVTDVPGSEYDLYIIICVRHQVGTAFDVLEYPFSIFKKYKIPEIKAKCPRNRGKKYQPLKYIETYLPDSLYKLP